MNTIHRTLLIARTPALLALLLAFAACGGGGSGGTSLADLAPPNQPSNVISTARSYGGFDTLLTAIEDAGLTETLENEGPFTILAPTDNAFAKIPAADLNALLADREALRNVLLYHVIPGRLTGDDLIGRGFVNSLQGGSLTITEGSVLVNGVKVLQANVESGNGIIHAIETVLTAPSPLDIIDLASAAGTFETLLLALETADLDEVLRGAGPFTVFAPNDEAFAKLPPAEVEALLADKPRLQYWLLYHVVAGYVPSTALDGVTSAETEAKQPILFDLSSGVIVNQSAVIDPDLRPRNGIIHVIDSVLMPPEMNIPQKAAMAGLATLLTAVEIAELVVTLESEGPFTVFAPTEEAFQKIPANELNGLLADRTALRNLLLTHVVAGRVLSGDLSGQFDVTTESGVAVNIDARDGVKVDGANVVLPDILVTNGVVHLIDTVIGR